MKAVYSIEPLKEIELSAIPSEWVSFAHALFLDGSTIEFESVADPSPYQHSARKITIAHQKGDKIEFQVQTDGNLTVKGDPQLMAVLSQNAMFPAGLEKGYHVHIEHYDIDDYYVGKGSVPTVFLLSSTG
jgi:hypothetical protein